MPALKSVYELLTITLFRFRWLPRIWAMLLIAVNAGSLLFLDTIYGQVALAVVSMGIVVMVAIHMRLGFVRLLGIGHVLWIPMLPWMLIQLSELDPSSWLYQWIVVLMVFNTISLVIDTIDVVRYVRGEREPHYRLNVDGVA